VKIWVPIVGGLLPLRSNAATGARLKELMARLGHTSAQAAIDELVMPSPRPGGASGQPSPHGYRWTQKPSSAFWPSSFLTG